MSQENVQVVMKLFEAAGQRDLGKMASLLTIDTVWTSTFRAPFDGEFHGPVGAVELLSRLVGAFDVFDVELLNVVSEEDTVVLVLREKMRSKTTGKVATNNAVVVATVRGGKISAVRMFGDSYAAYELLQPASP
jgi:ketosteroid isomerase-like protein